MTLSSLIAQFENRFMQRYGAQLLPSQHKALMALKVCRTEDAPLMQVHCDHCESDRYLPHSCGHRLCPHCQHYESQRWLENQCRKQLPASYFLITFTLPRELRRLCYARQRLVYGRMFACVRDTLKTFSLNDKQLQGAPGLMAVLHTHARNLDYHPHIHVLMPAAAVDKKQRLWREKSGKYLFCHQALATVFRAKLLQALVADHLSLPADMPTKWVVDVKNVGSGEKAIVYLGRYLYRGVIQERDIVSCEEGQVTFRYVAGKTGKTCTRTVSGEDFLWLVLQHVLPKGFRRARDYGFLHPNGKTLITVVQRILHHFQPQRLLQKIRPRPTLICACCGAEMRVVRVCIKAGLVGGIEQGNVSVQGLVPT